MNASSFLRFAALLAAVSLIAISARAADGSDIHRAPPDKTVVLVHGAFADGSCWNEVIRLLQGQGVKVVSVQNPLATLAGDVDAVNRVIEQQAQPVVLVGHSWGGFVVTHAGVNPKVKSLVYVAAFAPDVGDSVFSLLQAYPAPPWLGGIVQDSAGYQTLSEPAFLNHFATGLPTHQARTLFAVQAPTFGGTLYESATAAAWRGKPSWYLVADADQIIPADLQRSMAARMRARTASVPAGHLVILSQPARVAATILAAMRAP